MRAGAQAPALFVSANRKEDTVMAIADMIPTMSDIDLASLRVNAGRIEATAEGVKRQAAVDLIPLIEAEQAARLAAKPPKKPRAPAKPRVKKVVEVEVEAAA